MKLSSSKSHNGDDITALVETEIGPVNRSQSRPRIVFLFVLISVLALLVVIANAFVPTSQFSVSSDCNTSKEKCLSQQSIDDPYNREIIVLDYQEGYDEDEKYLPQDQEESEDSHTDNNNNNNNNNNNLEDWSNEQIDEMKRYYKRYLEVFFEKHGDEYEPEDMEVVYVEYLVFKERKIRQRDEKAKQKKKDQIIELTSQGYHSGTKEIENDVQKDQNDGASSLASSEIRPTQHHDDTIIIKQDPYYLEMEWEDFNEVGGDQFGPSNNYTETLATGFVPNTVVVVDPASVKDDPTLQQPLSGRGQVHTI